MERAARSERLKSSKCGPMTGFIGVSLRRWGVLREFKGKAQPEGSVAGSLANQEGRSVPKGCGLPDDAIDGRQPPSSKTAYGADTKNRKTVIVVRKAHGECRSLP